jgi:hypothetical protein
MDIEYRIKALERSLRATEDRAEILELLTAYGPLVDSGLADEAAGLWRDGGGYDIAMPVAHRLEAPRDLAAMYRSPMHTAMVAQGCGHFTAMPSLAIDGDHAEAVGYTFVARHGSDGWDVWRAAVNHWTLERTEAGWRIAERVNRSLDGSPPSHELMSKVAGFRGL